MFLLCRFACACDSCQAIEIFHLLFLRAFGARVDKTLFAVKGGCNLRFFLKSIRYSEDMDLDIHTLSVGTLKSNVERVLDAQSFTQTLRAQNIEIAATSAPKQTGTTQRWKLTLRLTESGTEIPTKILEPPNLCRRANQGTKAPKSLTVFALFLRCLFTSARDSVRVRVR